MHLDRDPDGHLVIELTEAEGSALAKKVIQCAEDAHTSVLNFAYLINEAWYDARNTFRPPAERRPTGTGESR